MQQIGDFFHDAYQTVGDDVLGFVADHLNQVPGFSWLTPEEQHALKAVMIKLWNEAPDLFHQALNELVWILENPDKALKAVLEKLFSPATNYLTTTQHHATTLSATIPDTHQKAMAIVQPTLANMSAANLATLSQSFPMFAANSTTFGNPVGELIGGVIDIAGGIALIIGGIITAANTYRIVASITLVVNMITTTGDLIPIGVTQVIDAVVKAITLVLLVAVAASAVAEGTATIAKGVGQMQEAINDFQKTPDSNPFDFLKKYIKQIIIILLTGLAGGIAIAIHNATSPTNFSDADFQRWAKEMLGPGGVAEQFKDDCSEATLESILKKLAEKYPNLSEAQLRARAISILYGLKANAMLNDLLQEIKNDTTLSNAIKAKLRTKIYSIMLDGDPLTWSDTAGKGPYQQATGLWAEYKAASGDPTVQDVSRDVNDCLTGKTRDMDVYKVVNGQQIWVEVKNVSDPSNLYNDIYEGLVERMLMNEKCPGMNYMFEEDVPNGVNIVDLKNRLVKSLSQDSSLGLNSAQIDRMLKIRPIDFGQPNAGNWCQI